MTKQEERDRQKLFKEGLFPKIYHWRFSDGSAVTVCKVVPINNKSAEPIAEGYAVCSSKDMFSRSSGRNIAIGRAVKAYESRSASQDVFIGRKSGAASYMFKIHKYEYQPCTNLFKIE